MRTSIIAAVGLGLAGMIAGAAAAGDEWNQWRGPERSGRVADPLLPKVWPMDLRRLWTAEVGPGYSSPVVSGDKVYVFARRGDEESVSCLGLADGKPLWKAQYEAPYEPNSASAGHGKWPKSTPVVADGRLVTLGIGGILSCWDAAGGQRLWQKEFSKVYKKTSPLYGAAMSPLCEGGVCVAHVGGHNQGAIVALDAATGETRWTCDRDGPAYASPVLATIGGTRQIITQTQGACLGLAAADGKLLWSFLFRTAYDQNIVTPLVVGDRVFFGGTGQGTSAWTIAFKDGQWTAEKAWQNDDVTMYLSAPVWVSGRLYGLSEKRRGQFFCLDAGTGKPLWLGAGMKVENAALVAAGLNIAALLTDGQLVVFKTGTDAYDEIARYKVADTPTWAYPVFTGRGILIRDAAALTLWSAQGR